MLEADPAQQTVNSAAKRMSDSNRLAAAVTGKIEAGNFKAAIRIVCSEDKNIWNSLPNVVVMASSLEGPGKYYVGPVGAISQ